MRTRLKTRSYHEVPHWREYEKELPASFKLSSIFPQEEWFNWRNIAVHIDRLAAPEAPLKLILVHGIGGYGRIVLGFGAPFRPDLCEVVSPDLPGYGLTITPTKRFTFSAWTECLHDFIEAELQHDPRPIILFGLSLGGIVAYHVACTANVKGLIATAFIDMTNAKVAAGIARFVRLSSLSLPLVKGAPAFMSGLQLPAQLLSKLYAISNNAELARIVANDPYGGGTSIPLAFLQSIMATPPTIAPEHFKRCPVLLVHPGEDQMTDIAFSKWFFDRLAAAKEMVVLEGAGHWPIEEPGATQMIEAVRSFLEKLTR
jgi:pimeloyl-ACP methyl ester carboxylesterase